MYTNVHVYIHTCIMYIIVHVLDLTCTCNYGFMYTCLHLLALPLL